MARIFATALALGVCVMLPSVSEAQPNRLGTMDFARTNNVIQIKSDKQKQKDANKACGPNKVFVEGRCVKRENAEKRQEKAKEQEKAQQTPPAQTPKPLSFCCGASKPGGGGGYSGCAPTEAKARQDAEQAAQKYGYPLSSISCGPSKSQ